MKKDKELKLNPTIKKVDFSDLKELEEKQQDKKINDILSSDLIIQEESKDDSYFKAIIEQLFSNDSIEKKTEYLNVNENFLGAKLTFLAKFGNIPNLEEFVNIFERKRVSLERKGRKEIIMALEKREEEEQRQKDERLKNILGL